MMRWLGHIARTGKKKYVYILFLGGGKLKEREQLGDLVVDEKIIDLGQDRERWWALVCVLMKLRFP